MDVARITLEPRVLVGLRDVVPVAQMTDFFARAFTAAAAELDRHGIEPAGPPIGLYRGDVTETVDVTAGFPTQDRLEPSRDVVAVDLPTGPAVVTVHTGPYDAMEQTYDDLLRWMTENGLTGGHAMYEEYLTGPQSGLEPAMWQTRIVYPLA